MFPCPHCRPIGPATIALILALTPARLPAQQNPSPPVAKVVEHVDTVAGVEWRDPYAWLRDDKRQRPEVLSHLRAENAYTEAMTRHTAALQERLYQEMVGHIKETDLSVPQLDNEYYYYTRTVKGREYPIFCRKRGSLSAPEQVLLDENALARGHGYSRVGVRRRARMETCWPIPRTRPARSGIRSTSRISEPAPCFRTKSIA